MARIVAIEDDSDLRDAIEYGLRRAGHDVIAVGTGAAGLRHAMHDRPDLVLLDLLLPDLSGLEVCRMLRENEATKHLPVIMLTAKASEADRITGFETGAHDYVVKPFSMRELILRIDVALRRPARSTDDPQRIAFGQVVADRHAMRVWVGGRETRLAPVERKLLIALFDCRGAMCTRAHLLGVVWGLPENTGTRTVDTHVKRLRQKLGASGKLIETVRGVGYRLAWESDETAAT